MPQAPHDFPRRVLLCVTGLSPQIVTETLYALAVETEGKPAFVPTEIHLITTVTGEEQARLSLLAPDRDQFGRLCRDYGLQGIRFDAGCIELIHDQNDRPIEDIRSLEDNDAAADTITRRIAEYTRDGKCALHVSIAGGRKTMGFFAGYALSLYGRAQDRLSHVLVSPRFEGHPEFFFKPRQPVTLMDRERREMSTASARIQLAEIPFVPLREGLHRSLLNRAAGYVETVRAWRAGGADEHLQIDIAEQRLRWRGAAISLKPAELAVYSWLADRRLRGLDEGWTSRQSLAADLALQKDFADSVMRRCGDASPSYYVVEEFFLSPEGLRRVPSRKTGWIGPHISRINRRIEDAFGSSALARIGISARGRRGAHDYRLACELEALQFLD